MKLDLHIISFLMVLALNSFSLSGVMADELSQAIDKICAQDHYACARRSRFQSYQPNFAIFRAEEGKDNPVQFHYSFRYYLSEPDCIKGSAIKYSKLRLTCLQGFHRRKELYLTYTGDFDFYMGARESSPVINRISNPAIHLRKYLTTSFRPLIWLDIALEHRSNGQVVDANEVVDDPSSSNNGRYRAQIEYENQNFQYFDALSRSVNYVSLEGHFLFNLSGKKSCRGLSCLKLWLQIKQLYSSEESNITWGPIAGQGRRFSDYDRFRFVLSTQIPSSWSKMELSTVWHVGDQWFDEDSVDVQLFFPVYILKKRIPFFFRYHSGPMATLSDYSQHQKSYGFGLNFY